MKRVIKRFPLVFAGLLAASWVNFGLRGMASTSAGKRWGADYFPNVPLINQDGKSFRFYDELIRGKVVLIHFIYTGCHDSCPLEAAKLRQVQELLGTSLGRDVYFYSISIDPDRDTPPKLREFAGKFGAGPGWQFLTGKKDDLALLRKKLGMGKPAEKLSDHNTSFLIGNEATGEWMKRSPFDNPRSLALLLGERLRSFRASTGRRGKSYAKAPPLAALTRGEYLFRSRCQSCHSVGKGDGIGPDLLGVAAKRERKWLVRWLKNPEKLLEEKDPIALELYSRFKEVPMPNLKLGDAEVDALIDYLKTKVRM